MELVSVKVLVIGGVAAGTKAAAKLKREDRGLDVALITRIFLTRAADCLIM